MPDLGILNPAEIWPYILVGIAAQMVDGALGMAFGVISSTLLVSVLGVPPAQASAGVHFAEVFTTGASGLSHAWHRNIDWGLFAKLVLPGVGGGILGAYVLANVDASIARPLVMAYLTGIGLVLLYRAWRFPTPKFEDPRIVAPLGAAGGFLDAAGGGGWGPVVTSNLLIQGGEPRKTIGTVSTSEFFLTVSISVTFILTLGFEAFTTATIGLLIGGVIAAPFGAILAKNVRPRTLLFMVGTVLTITSVYSIYKALS
ncbi:sulfite exporter TauE/SafE family protein [Blastomonas sp. UPD001]|uniref:sulfite exporter TauE/SafE family protein n=1 Tax=unclassified Blastomonas TaxID=2626550 RepID=UPI000E34567C|nr:sulfite exporter TauE/SafE family protein [Blastomonas sp. UPD001]MBL0965361.1 sulfite exporter TauE/SafE family protein [Blastomonas sp.]